MPQPKQNWLSNIRINFPPNNSYTYFTVECLGLMFRIWEVLVQYSALSATILKLFVVSLNPSK